VQDPLRLIQQRQDQEREYRHIPLGQLNHPPKEMPIHLAKLVIGKQTAVPRIKTGCKFLRGRLIRYR
jgi:hypothetical protein